MFAKGLFAILVASYHLYHVYLGITTGAIETFGGRSGGHSSGLATFTESPSAFIFYFMYYAIIGFAFTFGFFYIIRKKQ